MSYIENPKTQNSGIVCCIPHKTSCPMKCLDCFFQSGKSYLEPLEQNLPNMPDVSHVGDRLVRVNDGNDSSYEMDMVLEATKCYPKRFYNTSIPKNLGKFVEPVVLTLNPAGMTDKDIHVLPTIPKNLMFVRVRMNTWNLLVVDKAVDYYTSKDVPVVLTFMAYYDESSISLDYKRDYIYRKRTLNSYWAITTDAWRNIMDRYKNNLRVYSCGKIEGERGKTSCKYCGNCLREYFANKEKIKR